jgi:hypothetical protein
MGCIFLRGGKLISQFDLALARYKTRPPQRVRICIGVTRLQNVALLHFALRACAQRKRKNTFTFALLTSVFVELISQFDLVTLRYTKSLP